MVKIVHIIIRFLQYVNQCVLIQLKYLNCSDRKAIISQGKLKCVGSSFFLKTHFGIGYQLSYVSLFVDILCFCFVQILWYFLVCQCQCF